VSEKLTRVILPGYTLGQDAYKALASDALHYGRRLLLIGGRKALQAGQGRLKEALAGTDLTLVGSLHYGADCTFKAAQALAQAAKQLKADVICGMGGGRALDTAKAAGELAGLPVFTLPTIAATCAAVTRLSVMYNETGAFERFLFLNEAPKHCFIDLDVLAHAPQKYLRAGIGDSLAKHVETPFAVRGALIDHADAMGVSIAEGLFTQLSAHGPQAMADAHSGLAGPSLEMVCLSSIVSTGYVSLLVKERFNGALAHSLYYALEHLPPMKRQLHGDVVAWGALVQLEMDGQREKAQALRHLLLTLRVPVSLRRMNIDPSAPEVRDSLRSVLMQPDMQFLPYTVTEPMIWEALRDVEARDEEDLKGV
jgi:glycerol dehydrogenase-like iron-containing ADH family enzyme